MKKYISFIAVGALALSLIASPLAGFAKENGKNGKENKGNGDKNKVEKVVRAQNQRDSDDDDNDDSEERSDSSKKESFSKCVKAFGHLIAPGWLKKNSLPEIDSSNCWMPFGIGKKFRGNNASSTPDVTAPVISNLAFTAAKTQAEVRWTTNENANSVVFWDTDSTVDTSDSATNRITKNDFVKNHKVILKNLTASTTYYVVVKSRDAAGNATLSAVGSFTTKAPTADSSAPVISNVVTIIGTSTIQVGWKTNENTTDRVYYSTILPVVLNASTTSFVSNAIAGQNHSLTLSGLTPNTTYYVIIESTDGAGNVTTSATFSAHTNALPVVVDVTAPVLSNLVVAPGSSTTTVTWTTDELSTSRVFYSTVTPLDIGASTTASVLNGSLVTSHSISLSGLATSTAYHFKVQSIDGSGNTATSGEVTATTTSGI